MNRESTTATRSRRRWLQFSLRTLMLVVVPIACLLAWYAAERRTVYQEHKAVEWVNGLGGRVSFNTNSPNRWRRYLVGDDFPGEVTGVELDFHSSVPYARSAVPYAQRVRMNRHTLRLPSTENLVPLATLIQLKHVRIAGWEKGNLVPLANLVQLEHLYLRGTQVEDLSPLGGLPRLRELNLRECPVRDFQPLGSIPTLEWLYIEARHDTELTPLYQLRQLRYLGIGDADTMAESVSAEQLDALRAALPQCRVVTYYPGNLDRFRFRR